MQLVDFFSGIGGFSLAAEWMGWEVISHCEIDPFCQKVLKHHWPDVYLHDDIKTFTYDTLKRAGWDERRTTVFAGGFPCQPFSQAGKRKGTADSRNLWPEYYRVIREVRPDYVVGENVSGLITMEDGQVFDEILSDLESEGYQVESYLIPASGVEAWHCRERIFVVGYAPGKRLAQSEAGKFIKSVSNAERTGIPLNNASRSHTNTSRTNTDSIGLHREKKHKFRRAKQGGTELRYEQERDAGQVGRDVPNTDTGLSKRQKQKVRPRRTTSSYSGKDVSSPTGQRLPEQGMYVNTNNTEEVRTGKGNQPVDGSIKGDRPVEPNMGRMVDGIPPELDGYWDWEPEGVPRTSFRTPDRKDRLKSLGNAVVPQVVYELYKAITVHYLTKSATEQS